MENKEQIETKKGCYSAGKIVLAFLIFTLIFVFFTSHNLYIRASNIQNQQVKKILLFVLQPIDTFASKIKVNTFFDNSRKVLLNLAELDKMPNWEEFYYVQEGVEMQTDVVAVAPAKNNDAEDVQIEESSDVNQRDSDDERKNENDEDDENLKQDEIELEENIEKDDSNKEIDEGREEDFPSAEMNDGAPEEDAPSPYLYDEEKPFRILMVGDSQMYSIANGLKKLTAGQDAIEITDFSIQSSGFIRGDYYNWEKKIANIFSEQETGYYHVAVVLLGMNDYQDIFYGNTYLVRETKGWEERYRDKIVRVMNLLLLHTKKVYWLGMPIVRRGTYNDDLRYIDKVQEAVAKEYHHSGLQRVSLANIAPGEGVPFTETIQKEDGQIIRLMKSDGVHYTLAGGEYIMSSFLKDIYAQWYIKPPQEKN